MKTLNSILIVVLLLSAARAQDQPFAFYPGATYQTDVPTLQSVAGHAWGEKITMYHEAERYMKALAAASPNVELVPFGETWEGRTLYYMVVASEENMARLDNIKAGLQKLADPRKVNAAEAEALIGSLPVVVWLAYGVHGNEISSPDAALLTAYHLAAAQNDTLADAVLKNVVVVLDPMQNPDGRDRFINYFRQTRGRWPDGNQEAAEHREVWPGGRTNHYLFDMNRDWFAQTQPETRARLKAYLAWYPQVFVDLHEMGSNATYYFAPPADPLNPEFPPAQVEWLRKFGRHNAQWFDRMQFDYFTRETFDSFYPGYGEGWPMFHGAVGMTYEQASTRGLVVDREDKTTMHFRDAVQHHFIASLSTAENAARNRAGLLRYYYNHRRAAIDEGKKEEVKEFIIAPGNDPNRATKLATLLLQQGIEVKQAGAAFENKSVEDYYGGGVQRKRFPAGTYVVSLAQPAKRLAKTLLAKHVQMDEAFIKEQIRRQKKRLRDEIYDLTGWSLPLLYDVECYMAHAPSSGRFTVLTGPPASTGGIEGGKARVAYLVSWGTNSAAQALAELLREGVRVFSTDKPFTLNGRAYPRGTLIIKAKNNPADLQETLGRIAKKYNLQVRATNSSWVEDGVNFGSNNVRFIKKPKIAMAYNMPTSAGSAGWTRYLLEQEYNYPVTIIHTRQLNSADLSKFNVLILPNTWGSYSGTINSGGVSRIKDWVRSGGTLITSGGATHWLTGEKVGLLATHRELRGGKPDKPEPKPQPQSAAEKKPDLNKPFDVEKEIQPEKELPAAVPGAIMRITLDTEHWLAFGYDGDANVLVSSRNIFTPLKLDKGRNVALYMPEDKLLLSGFAWEDTEKQLANKAYLMHQRLGRGNVVAFAEDPNYRAFCDGLNLLFVNAVFLGPSH